MADKKLYVQAGSSVTTLAGLKGPGEEVEVKMFKGGQKSVDGLIKKEIIGENKPDLRTKAEIVKEREEKKLAEKNKKAKADAEKKDLAGGAKAK